MRKAVKAASTLRSDNLDALYLEENDTELLNHQHPADLLIDPDEIKSGDTHRIFSAIRRKKVSAEPVGFDDLDEEDLLVDPDEVDFPVDPVDDDLLADTDEQKEEKPEVTEADPLDLVQAENETDVMPSDIKPEKKIETEEALDKTEDKENDTTDVQRAGEKTGTAVEETAAKKVKAEEDEPVELQNNQEADKGLEVNAEFAIVDLDAIDDDIDDVAFAVCGSTKIVMHGTRVIAEMTDEAAEACGVSDVYLDDEFDEATLSEIQCKGLRAGLRAQGFTLASVKMKASAQVAATVAKEVANKTAQLAAEAKVRADNMDQCFALAAEGLNRNLFADYKNTLRASLTENLKALGIRNASRIVASAFAEHGGEYAKSLVKAASDIADLPEDSRLGLASQFDTTVEAEEDEEILSDPNLYGDPVAGEDETENVDVSDSVEAALRRPLKASVTRRVIDTETSLPFASYI